MDLLFTRLVKTKDSVREFNFKKLSSASMNLFHVNVHDDLGNKTAFRMQKAGENNWKIVEQGLPAWISEAAPELNAVIGEELQK